MKNLFLIVLLISGILAISCSKGSVGYSNIAPRSIEIMLKDKLINELEDINRESDELPMIQTIPNFSVFENDDGTYRFSWDYYNFGDYDLNGEVGVPDITPIAVNYLARIGDSNYYI